MGWAEFIGKTRPDHVKWDKGRAPGCPFLDRASECHLNLEIGDRERNISWATNIQGIDSHSFRLHWGWTVYGCFLSKVQGDVKDLALLAVPLFCCSNNHGVPFSMCKGVFMRNWENVIMHERAKMLSHRRLEGLEPRVSLEREQIFWMRGKKGVRVLADTF